MSHGGGVEMLCREKHLPFVNLRLYTQEEIMGASEKWSDITLKFVKYE